MLRGATFIMVMVLSICACAQNLPRPNRLGLSDWDPSVAERWGWRPCDRVLLMSSDPIISTQALRDYAQYAVKSRFIVMQEATIGVPDLLIWYEPQRGTHELKALYIRTQVVQARTGTWTDPGAVVREAIRLAERTCSMARGEQLPPEPPQQASGGNQSGDQRRETDPILRRRDELKNEKGAPDARPKSEQP